MRPVNGCVPSPKLARSMLLCALGQKLDPPMLTSVQKISLGLAVLLLMLAATYLYGVRGEALLLDLASMARGLLCF
jgi:hypothetical protein